MTRARRRTHDLRYQLAALIRETPDRVRSAVRPEWNPVYDTDDGRADCGLCRGRTYPYSPLPDAPVPVLRGTGSDGHDAGGGADQAPPPPALYRRYIPWSRSRAALLCGCEKRFGGCGAAISAPCVTADGRVTRPHKIRIDTAARTTQVASEPS